ncbi:MAG: hypothetical protein IKE94_02480 [Aeriscardovia sp.]|nr:hypothetical protein [Aeriscardovia sp.]
MNVILYKLSKRSNSTKKPANDTPKLELSCLVKTPSSVIDPVLEIKKTGSLEVFDYNYCYIPDWRRYYFITNCTFNMGLWLVNCTVDVLASYKNSIKASSQYLIRSAQVYNDDLIDSFYPTETPTSGRMSQTAVSGQPQCYYQGTWYDSTYFDVDIDDGVVVIGILSGSNTGVSYYWLNMNTWADFISQIQNYVPSDMGSISNGIAKALFDPIQYITYCRWFPTRPLFVGGSVTSINIGGVDFNLGASAVAFVIKSNQGVNSFRKTGISIPSHPQKASYPYTALAPYSTYSLYFEPFGLIPLDSTLLYGASSISLFWDIDFLTGATMLTVESDTGIMVTKSRGSIGVPLSISKTTVSVDNGLVLGAVGYVASKGKEIASDLSLSTRKSWLGNGDARNNSPYAWKTGQSETTLSDLASNISDNLDVVKGVTDSLLSVMGQVSVSGTAGSFLIYTLRPVLYAYFMIQTEHNDTKFGRPCMETHSLSDISGFIQCGNAAVDYTGVSSEAFPMETEKQAVASFLNNGVYIE